MEQYLEQFRKLFPLTRVTVYDNEMRYRLRSEDAALRFEQIALSLIMVNRLPLVVTTEVWRRSGLVFEINLVIAYAPSMEELMCY